MITLKEIPSGWQVEPSPTNDGVNPLPEQDEDIQARTDHIRDLLLEERTLHLRDGLHVVGQLTVPHLGGIYGQSLGVRIRARDQLNKHLIVSDHDPAWEDMPSTDAPKWHKDGVPYRCSLRNLTIDGNRDNQTAGDAVHFYTLHPQLHNLEIWCAKDRAAYLRLGGGKGLGGPDEWDNQVSHTGGNITDLAVASCGHGLWMEHMADAMLDNLRIKMCNGTGIYSYCSVAQYGKVHVTACGSDGNDPAVDIVARAHFAQLQTDTSNGTAVRVGADYTHITHWHTINDCCVYADQKQAMQVIGSDLTIDKLTGWIEPDRRGVRILQQGERAQINGISLRRRDGRSGTGIFSAANSITLRGNLQGFKNGVWIGSSGDVNGNVIDMDIQDCDNPLQGLKGNGNRIDIRYTNCENAPTLGGGGDTDNDITYRDTTQP